MALQTARAARDFLKAIFPQADGGEAADRFRVCFDPLGSSSIQVTKRGPRGGPIFLKVANSQGSVTFSREVAERIWVA